MNKLFPEFVRIVRKGIELRRTFEAASFAIYRRDVGGWDVKARWQNDSLRTVSDDPHMNNLEMVSITREQWEKGNRGYIPEGLKDGK